MSRDLSVSTIFFNRASLGTDSRTISPLRSINASTLLDVDRVMPKRRSTSCGKISRSEWRARKVMMSMLPPLRLSTSMGRVTARYRLMTLCSDRMATLGGLHAPRSHASVNAGVHRSRSIVLYIVHGTYDNTLYIQQLHMQHSACRV